MVHVGCREWMWIAFTCVCEREHVTSHTERIDVLWRSCHLLYGRQRTIQSGEEEDVIYYLREIGGVQRRRWKELS